MIESLPTYDSPIIGRQTEIDTALKLLRQTDPPVRLITFTGPGGIGKTRLALEVDLEREVGPSCRRACQASALPRLIFRTAQAVNSGHGWIEIRTLTTSSLLNETCDWPGMAQVFKLERNSQIVARGQTRAEVV